MLSGKAKIKSLQHYNLRPENSTIDTIVVHSMYAQFEPESKQFDPETCIAILDREKVSTHYSIDQQGGLWLSVAEEHRAWHAGQSQLPFNNDQRSGVNDFSIGIELIGKPESDFTLEQYQALILLIKDILTRHKIKYILGHDQISPGRKTDPGPKFDWQKLKDVFSSELRFA